MFQSRDIDLQTRWKIGREFARDGANLWYTACRVICRVCGICWVRVRVVNERTTGGVCACCLASVVARAMSLLLPRWHHRAYSAEGLLPSRARVMYVVCACDHGSDMDPTSRIHDGAGVMHDDRCSVTCCAVECESWGCTCISVLKLETDERWVWRRFPWLRQ